MEDITQLLQKRSNYSSYESTDSDSDIDESSQQLVQSEKTGAQHDEKCRMPTRRPNPNVYNRNALLARENRRKKKAHLEALEKELDEMRVANRQLKKALKRQVRTTGRLEREKRYYQNIVANRVEIKSLIKALNDRLPLQQANESSTEQLPLKQSYLSPTASSISSEPLSINFELSENGSVGTTQLFNPQDFPISSCGFLEPLSSDLEHSSVFTDPWSDLLEGEFDFKEGDSQRTTKLNNIADEHSYVDIHQGRLGWRWCSRVQSYHPKSYSFAKLKRSYWNGCQNVLFQRKWFRRKGAVQRLSKLNKHEP